MSKILFDPIVNRIKKLKTTGSDFIVLCEYENHLSRSNVSAYLQHYA